MAFGHICFVPSRAKQASVSTVLDPPATGTNLKRDAGKTEDSLRDRIQLEDVSQSLSYCHLGELTSAKTAPYLIAMSITLSVGASIIGECSFNKASSSLSNKCRDSAYADIVSWMRCAVAKKRTVGLAEKCNSTKQRCFPTRITSALLYQI